MPQLSTPETGNIYARRKTDVEPVFGQMKACLGVTRYHVRGLEKVKKETGLVVLAFNMMKLAVRERTTTLSDKKNSTSLKIFCRFSRSAIFLMLIETTYVTASFFYGILLVKRSRNMKLAGVHRIMLLVLRVDVFSIKNI